MRKKRAEFIASWGENIIHTDYCSFESTLQCEFTRYGQWRIGPVGDKDIAVKS